MANYSIFHIEQQISDIKSRLHNIKPDIDISDCSPELINAIDPIMNITLQQIVQCRDLFLLQEKDIFSFQKKTSAYNNMALHSTALIIQYLSEVESYLKTKGPMIISPDEKDRDGMVLVFHKLFSYYLSIYKEIYILASHKAYKGAAARYRILIELYCIYKYFANYPNSIRRFADHYFLKDYLSKEKYSPELITSDDISMYTLVRERYSSEYKTYKLNYGWIIHKVSNYNSIKEVMKYALKDDLDFIKKEYDLYSEYSHASLFIALQSKDLNIPAVLQFLCKSGGLSIFMARFYINFLINISDEKGRDLYYLFHFLELLSNEILKMYNHGQSNSSKSGGQACT